MESPVRRYWWVNQNQTFRHEREGGYLWSPKSRSDGSRNPFYDYMRIVAPGDLVLSFVNRQIAALSVATSHCYEAPKPQEFGRAGEYWGQIGWRVDVAGANGVRSGAKGRCGRVLEWAEGTSGVSSE